MGQPESSQRRRLLQCAAVALAVPAVARGQNGTPAPGRGLTIAQIVDTSASQQDVSKDFLIGSRAAWQDINGRGGLRGRAVNHQAVEVDGTAESLRAAMNALRDNPACIVLSGSAGDPVASQVTGILTTGKFEIAHAAPWLQNSSIDVGDRTFPIFAARQEQIAHALKSLSVMGVSALGVIYASAQDQVRYQDDLERIAQTIKLNISSYKAEGDLNRLGLKLNQNSPAVLLFLGGTPELVQFTQGLDTQARQRYIIALADVNLQTMYQMGGGRTTPVIGTQAVPMVTAPIPVVRRYRETMARLFDEPPAALSLAGFIAARYTYEVLQEIDGVLTRQNALAAFQRRTSLDVGGYRISFDQSRRSGSFVTQSMLTADGRVLG